MEIDHFRFLLDETAFYIFIYIKTILQKVLVKYNQYKFEMRCYTNLINLSSSFKKLHQCHCCFSHLKLERLIYSLAGHNVYSHLQIYLPDSFIFNMQLWRESVARNFERLLQTVFTIGCFYFFLDGCYDCSFDKQFPLNPHFFTILS